MRKRKSTWVLLIVLLIGLSLLLYPTLSNFWNSFHQTRAIAGYTEAVAGMDEEFYGQCLEEARAYNADLVGNAGRFLPTQEEHARYESLLDVAGNGIMGHVEIPAIDVELPVYHGVEDTILQVAIGRERPPGGNCRSSDRKSGSRGSGKTQENRRSRTISWIRTGRCRFWRPMGIFISGS